MSRIWYAAFSEEFVAPAREIFRRLGRDVLVRVWDPQCAAEMMENGVRVIMARGATTARIRRTVEIPVVDIPIPFEDMVSALITASRQGKNIGVIGYNNLLNGLELLNPILNVNIRQVFAVDSQDTYRQIVKLRQDRFDVIVGGLIQTQFARQLGMKSVRIDLSEKALEYACQQAEKLLESVMSATKKAEELKTILNTTRECYIAVDSGGRITLMNRRAKRFQPAGNAEGCPAAEIFPCFQAVRRVLETGEELIQETASINGTDILYDIIPLKYQGGEILGAIITFNDVGTITRGEYKIRDRIKKGFYAQYRFEHIAGYSTSVKECIRIAEKYAGTDSTVLILGETGAGKELFAQSMHNASPRARGPFVAVNCAALPEGILESELFGYEEGAFTGAKKSGKMGLFELAHNGTIFLDEISEMPLSLQSRLLRVLQEKRVMRLGGDRLFPVDIRVFAATNNDLMEQVRRRQFREDLFYRLNVLTLKIPPLRERKEDIPVLARKFLEAGGGGCRLTEDAYRAMQSYGWPGNVRQLTHFMEKVRTICDAPLVTGGAVLEMIGKYEPPFGNGPESSAPPSREEIAEALACAGGSKSRAAELLKMHRSTFWRYLKKYGISGRKEAP